MRDDPGMKKRRDSSLNGVSGRKRYVDVLVGNTSSVRNVAMSREMNSTSAKTQAFCGTSRTPAKAPTAFLPDQLHHCMGCYLRSKVYLIYIYQGKLQRGVHHLPCSRRAHCWNPPCPRTAASLMIHLFHPDIMHTCTLQLT